MIKTEEEFKRTKNAVGKGKEMIEEVSAMLKGRGFSDEEITNIISSEYQFALLKQMEWEIELYERIKKGDFSSIENNVGLMLIAYRIFRGLSREELAQRLGTTVDQVERDERNDYFGIDKQKLNQVMTALDVPEEWVNHLNSLL